MVAVSQVILSGRDNRWRPGRVRGGGCAQSARAGARAGGARAAAVTAGDAAFPAVQAEWTVLVPAVLPYQPRQFFLRELPPLRAVLAPVRNPGRPVTDGHADPDPVGRPGLGAHAHPASGVPVTGVARPGSAPPATQWKSRAGTPPGRRPSPRPRCRWPRQPS